jgi:hypothetical protein
VVLEIANLAIKTTMPVTELSQTQVPELEQDTDR